MGKLTVTKYDYPHTDKEGNIIKVETIELRKVTVPFTEDEINSMNAFQMSDFGHPFTCGESGEIEGHPGHVRLYATKTGWRCPYCDYKQDWAHEIMTDWTWKGLVLYKSSKLLQSG